MDSAEYPPEILELLRQQEEIKRKIEAWRNKQQEKAELDLFVGHLTKKRTFHNLKFNLPPPKRLRRCFHNIEVIQQREEELAKERAEIREECLKDIQEYLESL